MCAQAYGCDVVASSAHAQSGTHVWVAMATANSYCIMVANHDLSLVLKLELMYMIDAYSSLGVVLDL